MHCTGGRCSATASCCTGGPCPVSALRDRVLGHSTDVATRCTGGLCQLLRPLRRRTGSSRCASLRRWSVFSQTLAPAFPGSPASSFPFLRGYASRASEDVKTTKTASGHAAPPFGRMPAVDVQQASEHLLFSGGASPAIPLPSWEALAKPLRKRRLRLRPRALLQPGMACRRSAFNFASGRLISWWKLCRHVLFPAGIRWPGQRGCGGFKDCSQRC